MADPDLQRRIEALEEAVRRLSVQQMVSFSEAVEEHASQVATWQADERFWFSDTAGIALTKVEQQALRSLWTRMLAGLAYAANNEEVELYVARPTLMGRLDRLVAPRGQLIEGRATMVLEREVGGEVWRGVIGIWNALCAALLEERLPSDLRNDLGFVWRRVIGGDLAV